MKPSESDWIRREGAYYGARICRRDLYVPRQIVQFLVFIWLNKTNLKNSSSVLLFSGFVFVRKKRKETCESCEITRVTSLRANATRNTRDSKSGNTTWGKVEPRRLLNKREKSTVAAPRWQQQRRGVCARRTYYDYYNYNILVNNINNRNSENKDKVDGEGTAKEEDIRCGRWIKSVEVWIPWTAPRPRRCHRGARPGPPTTWAPRPYEISVRSPVARPLPPPPPPPPPPQHPRSHRYNPRARQRRRSRHRQSPRGTRYNRLFHNRGQYRGLRRRRFSCRPSTLRHRGPLVETVRQNIQNLSFLFIHVIFRYAKIKKIL